MQELGVLHGSKIGAKFLTEIILFALYLAIFNILYYLQIYGILREINCEKQFLNLTEKYLP